MTCPIWIETEFKWRHLWRVNDDALEALYQDYIKNRGWLARVLTSFNPPPRNKKELEAAQDQYYADRRRDHDEYMERKRRWSWANPHHPDSFLCQHNNNMARMHTLADREASYNRKPKHERSEEEFNAIVEYARPLMSDTSADNLLK